MADRVDLVLPLPPGAFPPATGDGDLRQGIGAEPSPRFAAELRRPLAGRSDPNGGVWTRAAGVVAAVAEDGNGKLTGALFSAATLGLAPARGAKALVRRGSGVDWEAEGLLDGVSGEEHEQRKLLLEHLCRGGVPIDELRRAIEEDRLVLLPVEHVLDGGDRFTCRDMAAELGVEVDVLRGDLIALGWAVPEGEAAAFDEHDLAAARALMAFREAGLDGDRLRDVGRVVGQSLSTVAAAVRELIGDCGLEEGIGEHDLGVRYAHLARDLAPELQTLVAHAVHVHLREGVREDVVRDVERQTGRLPETTTATIAFADLVGFTALGDGEPPARLATVADRFASLAVDASSSPVKLVKLLGDGAMFRCVDAAALVDAVHGLMESVSADGGDLPPLRIGIATGPVLMRRGDVYGGTVNLAARLCDAAEAGHLLADTATREACPGLAWEDGDTREIKGFTEPVETATLTL